MIEVHRGLCRRKWSHYTLRRVIEPAITELSRSDYLFVEENFYKMSLVKIEGYMIYSDWIAKRYPGYLLDKTTNQIVPSTDHRVHLDEFFALMRSTDIARYEKEKDKFFGPSGRFTTGNSVEQMSVLYATFPRSGSSMMRKYFENISGIATGSDLNLKFSLNVAL